jgi:hypothetical protein
MLAGVATLGGLKIRMQRPVWGLVRTSCRAGFDGENYPGAVFLLASEELK